MTRGEKIAKLRKLGGLSQEDLSEKLGVSRQAISKWESDAAYPTNDNLIQLCKIFNVPISEMFDEGDLPLERPTDTPLQAQEEFKETAVKQKNKSNSLIKVAAIGATAALVLITYTTNLQIKALKDEMNSLKNYVYSLNNSYIINQPSESQYTDFNSEIGEFDRENGTINIKISVVPKAYTQTTTAQICIKGKTQTTLETAQLVDGVYKADLNVPMEQGLDTYLYLTDEGQTKSIYLTSFGDLADRYTMEVKVKDQTNNIFAKGKISVTGELAISVIGGIGIGETDFYVYPEKAVIEVYVDKELYTTLPCENLMRHRENINKLDGDDKKNENALSQYAGESTYFEQILLDINKPGLTKDSDIEYKVIVTDNFGQEYVQAVKGLMQAG